MFIDYTDLDGGFASFNANRFVRMRDAIGDFEPIDTLTIRLDAKRIHCASNFEDLFEAVGVTLPVCRLTNPNGSPTALASQRILSITAATSQNHHAAKSVVSMHIVGGPIVEYAVRESLDDAKEIVSKSIGQWPSTS